MKHTVSGKRAKYEAWLFMMLVLVFCTSSIINFKSLFSAYEYFSCLGFLLSHLYIILWFLSSIILRNNKGWVKTAFIVSWATFISLFLTSFLTHNGLDLKYAICEVFALVPFGVLIPVYGGLYSEFLRSSLFRILPLTQAIISTALFCRMKMQGKKPPP